MALRNWKYARGIEPATRANLVAHLTNNGWTVCQCRGEADVCISRWPGPGPGRHVVVASSDSDFLFHNVRTLLRQDPQRRSTFHRIDIMTDIVNHLGITEAEWVSAGIISNNDYATSLLRCSFSRNLMMINNTYHRFIPSVQPNPLDQPRQLLPRFGRASGTDVAIFNAHYKNSFDIFLRSHEDVIINGTVVVDNSAIDGRSVAMIQGIELLFRQYKDYHRALRTPAPAPVALVPGPAAPSPALAAPVATPPRPFKKYMPPNKYNPR
ncbi:hypothetical protein BGX26_002245 [Mortierella sp. AD094]|nr:hypothetical protein BGX26_002245 [Mortierella sp. AD094]